MTSDQSTGLSKVPTLRSVVKSGKESVIQTTRIGNQIEHEMGQNLGSALSEELIQAMSERKHAARDSQNHANTGPIDHQDDADEQNSDVTTTSLAPRSTELDETLEYLIDDIVDRHVTALREDIRQLLECVLAKNR